MRRTTFKVDNTVYWTIRTYTDAGVLVDADSTPSVSVRKNGASVADSVTVTKRAATTGIYDCVYNPAGEVEGDCFTIEETATISSQAYENAWSLEAQAAERGTDNASTFDPASDAVANVTLVDTTTNLTNGGGGGGGDATAANQTSIINAIAGLNDFDPAVDQVITDTASREASKADVSTLATQASVDSIDGDIQNIGSDVSTILTDTNELQQNQGDWATATGFSTFDHTTDAVITDAASRNASKADVSGLSTFDPSTDEVTTDAASRAASKADVSGLSTFDPSTDQVVASNMRGTDNALLAADAPTNFSILAISGTGAVTANGGGGGGGDDAATIYSYFTASNREDAFKATGFNTVAPDNASIAAILADTNELQGNQADWATATGFATPADLTAALSPVVTSIGNLNDFDPANDVVAHVTLVDTTTDLTNQSGGGTNPADIYTYFTDGTREDVFKADTSGLSTFDPASDVVARVTLVDTTTDLTNQTAGGVGMFQASVLITDSSGNALQGARVNVDGTTLSLTTGVSGTVQFNLDSGVYLLNVLPPANYDTPAGQVLTITASDPAQTVFSLTETSPPSGCNVPWIG